MVEPYTDCRCVARRLSMACRLRIKQDFFSTSLILFVCRHAKCGHAVAGREMFDVNDNDIPEPKFMDAKRIENGLRFQERRCVPSLDTQKMAIPAVTDNDCQKVVLYAAKSLCEAAHAR
jgi:hypothetical protein